MSVWPVMEFSRGETTTYERSLQCTRNLTRSLHNMFKVNRSAATGTICSEQVADPPPDHMIILRHLSSRPSFSCYLLVAVMLLVGGSATKQFCNPLNPTQQSCRTNSQNLNHDYIWVISPLWASPISTSFYAELLLSVASSPKFGFWISSNALQGFLVHLNSCSPSRSIWSFHGYPCVWWAPAFTTHQVLMAPLLRPTSRLRKPCRSDPQFTAGFYSPWRIHGAGIYANMTGVYWL